MPGPVTPVPRRPDDEAPLRLVLGALLGLHDQAPATWEYAQWVRELARHFRRLPRRYNGYMLVKIQDGRIEHAVPVRWDDAA